MKGFLAVARNCFEVSLVILTAVAGRASASDAASLLSAQKPAESQIKTIFSPSQLLNMAFTSAELSRLADSSGAASCGTSDAIALSRGADRAMARGCVESMERSYFRRFDVAARTRGSREIGLPSYRTNSLTASEIQKSAVNRLSSRAATRSVSNNVVLRSLVEGKVDVDLALHGEVSSPEPAHSKPTYTLAVNYQEVADRGLLMTSGVRSSFGLLGGRSRGTASLVADRQIVEVWPSSAPSNPSVAAPRTFRLTEMAQRALGLSAEPFSNIRLRVERSGGFGLDGLSLSLEEASGVAKADLSGLVRGDRNGIAWTVRVPFFAHAAVFSADNLKQKTLLGYEFRPSSNMTARVTFNRNIETRSTVSDLDSARYSLAFGYRI